MSHTETRKNNEPTLGDLAAKGFKRISNLAKSSYISEKLIALNSVLFVIIIALGLTGFFISDGSLFSLVGIVILFIFVLVGFALTLGYAPLIEMLSDLAKDKISSLRQSIFALLLSLPFAMYGVISKSQIALVIAFGLIGAQVIIFLVAAVVDLTPGLLKDRIVPSFDFKETLNVVGSIASILSLIITLAILFFGS